MFPEMELMGFLSQVTSVLLPLTVAAVLGGIIGMERESIERPAGFRTHILVAVGSALVMLVSVEVYSRFGNVADPGRIAAQVVSGIGFLGAGTILRSGLRVRGLTTAASLWAVSALGLASGMKLYGYAVASTVIILAVLIPLRRLEERLRRSSGRSGRPEKARIRKGTGEDDSTSGT
ncbi:MAG: MgtC/SapB family protein [Candidatus Fermentithermobacillus carboniphilus]|uniref:MgtC/SapB family protein n=1 Tax=Candidatus Fermentithermobacillus carboniphilus TaxID=3085328 RepID=A0AAT9LDN7_9FIRM|nr:MAG: MgtC/SapB family protein [Candidatus Fermentithermobacillus carboniphilus]